MARILLAEDDMSVREFVRRALEKGGHLVTLAHDGGEAMTAFQRPGAEFDLLLADIKMPVMDGIVLALRVSRDRPGLPVVLMTGFADQRERAHGLESLVEDVLIKPFTLDQLIATVDRVLSSSRGA